MDSSDQADRISNLPDVLLVLIVSCLSFKECVQTCALSKRWRSVYLETRNVSFKETDFFSPSVNANPIRNALGRIVFIDYVRRWVARIHDQPIDTFRVSISYPKTYLAVIKSLIAFAVRKRGQELGSWFLKPGVENLSRCKPWWVGCWNPTKRLWSSDSWFVESWRVQEVWLRKTIKPREAKYRFFQIDGTDESWTFAKDFNVDPI